MHDATVEPSKEADQGAKGEPLAKPVGRRGLLAGLAAVGAAALVKLSGTDRAEATNGQPVLLGADNTGTAATTYLDGTPGPPACILIVQNSSSNGDGISASAGGGNALGGRGAGVRSFGGNLTAGSPVAAVAGPGVVGVGGSAQQSGTSAGPGINALGGFGLAANTNGGSGVLAKGSAGGSGGTDGNGVDATAGGAGNGTAIGVNGKSGSAIGVRGLGLDATGIGVEGLTAGSGDGVFGASATGKGVHGQSSGFGVYGLGTGNTPGASAGVFGGADNAPGVQGFSSNSIAVHGFCSNVGLGVYGQSLINYGVVAESNTNVALFALSKVANAAAVYGQNSFVGPGKLAARFDGDVVVNGNFTVSGGAKAAAVTMSDGSQRMMYCQESPEPYFEDAGRGQLSGGSARVNLEPMFASLVKLDDYLVFLTPQGETEGLYVANQDAGGFTVRELRGGKSSVGFTYRLMAKRKDIAGGRLAPVASDGTRVVVAPIAPPVPQNALVPSPSVLTPGQPVPVGAGGQASQPGVPGGPKGR